MSSTTFHLTYSYLPTFYTLVAFVLFNLVRYRDAWERLGKTDVLKLDGKVSPQTRFLALHLTDILKLDGKISPQTKFFASHLTDVLKLDRKVSPQTKFLALHLTVVLKRDGKVSPRLRRGARRGFFSPLLVFYYHHHGRSRIHLYR